MTPEEARRKALTFLNSDYDPRLDRRKSSFLSVLYWRLKLWLRK